MGISTEGICCYGIFIGDPDQVDEEDCENYPKEILKINKEFDDDVEDYWKDKKGYKPPFEIIDDDGNWIEGISEVEKCKYYKHRMDWFGKNPPPFELVNVCCCDCPSWIIAMPGSVNYANPGYPIPIDKKFDSYTEEECYDIYTNFINFLKEIGITDTPQWYLGTCTC